MKNPNIFCGSADHQTMAIFGALLLTVVFAFFCLYAPRTLYVNLYTLVFSVNLPPHGIVRLDPGPLHNVPLLVFHICNYSRT